MEVVLILKMTHWLFKKMQIMEHCTGCVTVDLAFEYNKNRVCISSGKNELTIQMIA